jgi:hypothetical protein
MADSTIGQQRAQLRMANQHITQADFESAAEAVRWLGAVQSQDYGGGKWALGLRSSTLTDAVVEQAFNEGAILRTHVMRPTWHFVTREDIGWMLMLTAPRVLAITANYYRQVDLDEATLEQANAVIIRALEGGNQLTKAELGAVMQQAGIDTKEALRLGHIMGYAELHSIVCSGAMRGKQHTFALLSERAPQTRKLDREETLAELTRRYFRSHGPATLKDYAWWSGLTTADAKAGIEMAKSQLESAIIDGVEYWFTETPAVVPAPSPAVTLLPNYDELIVGYTDRSAIYDEDHSDKLDARGNVLFNYTILMDGRIVGTWKRTFKKGKVIIEANPFNPLSDAQMEALKSAGQRYADFYRLAVEFS